MPRLGEGVPARISAQGGDIMNLGLLARQLVDCNFLCERDWTPGGLRGSIQKAFATCVIESGCADLEHFEVDLFYGSNDRIFGHPDEPDVSMIDLLPWHHKYFPESSPVRPLAPYEMPGLFGGVALWHGGTRSVLVESSVRALERTILSARRRGVAEAAALSSKLGYEMVGLIELACSYLLSCATPGVCHNFLEYGMFSDLRDYDEDDERPLEEQGAWMVAEEFAAHLPPSLLLRNLADGNRQHITLRQRAADSLRAALPFFTRRHSRRVVLPSGMAAEELVQAGLDLLHILARIRRRAKTTPIGNQFYAAQYYTRVEIPWPTLIRWNQSDWIGRVADLYNESAYEGGYLTECLWWRGWHLKAGPLLGEVKAGSGRSHPHPQSVAGVVASLRLFLQALAALNRVLCGLDHLPEDAEGGSLVEDRAHAKILAQRKAARLEEARKNRAARSRARVRV